MEIDFAALPENLAALGGIVTSLLAAVSSWRKAARAEVTALEAERRAAAGQKAFEFFNAQNDGVVLVLTYPGHPPEMDAVPWLKTNGWKVRHMGPLDFQGDLPFASPKFIADVEAADVVLLQGSTPEVNARIAAVPWFRECLQPGAGVVSLVPDERTRYNLKLWRAGDQGVTAIGTAEIAVRAIVARRAGMAFHHGVAAGGLAQAKEALKG